MLVCHFKIALTYYFITLRLFVKVASIKSWCLPMNHGAVTVQWTGC